MKKKLKYVVLLLIGTVFITTLTACQLGGNVKNLSVTSLKEKIENKDTFIVEVMRTGCSACESYAPTFNSVMGKYKLEAYQINTADLTDEESSELDSITYISGTPTTLFFVGGKLEDSYNKLVGAVTSDALKTRLKYLGFIEEK